MKTKILGTCGFGNTMIREFTEVDGMKKTDVYLKHLKEEPVRFVSYLGVPRSLDDVNIYQIFPVALDENITDLVKALVVFGVPTSGSCEGHDAHFSPRPEVFVDNSKRLETGEILRALQTLLDKFNKISDIEWAIIPLTEFEPKATMDRVFITTTLDASSEREFDRGHKSARELAYFIFTHAKKSMEEEHKHILSKRC